VDSIRAYLQLLRPANIVTALADVLAGYAIADALGTPGLPWLLAATACLYGGGVVLNDFFDRDLDAIERPERPIPSGRVQATAAAALGGGLMVVGVLAASAVTVQALAVAAAIAACVLVYDSWAKRHALGPAAMGACRGLNLCLGMAAAPVGLLGRWPLALVPFVYICSITAVSRGEVHGGKRRVAAGALAGVIGVVAAVAALGVRGDRVSLIFTVLLAWRVLPPFARAYRTPDPRTIRTAVRAGVLSLVVLDAALAAIYAGAAYGLAVLALSVLAYGLSRLFAVT
jgi:4-hydroxybenzoate polyprenyltransferase